MLVAGGYAYALAMLAVSVSLDRVQSAKSE